MSGPAITESAPAVRPTQVTAVVQQVRLYDQARELTREQFDATLAHANARTFYNTAAFDAQAKHVAARAEFVHTMTQVYRNPTDAVRRFEADAHVRSAGAAVETLTALPEAYGALRTVDRPGLARVFARANDTPARMAAHDAAIRALTVEQRRIEAIEVPRATVTLRETQHRLELATAEVRTLPTATRIERDLRVAVRDLTPAEHRAVAAQLTAAQQAFVQSMMSATRHAIRDTVRDIAMGTEGRER